MKFVQCSHENRWKPSAQGEKKVTPKLTCVVIRDFRDGLGSIGSGQLRFQHSQANDRAVQTQRCQNDLGKTQKTAQSRFATPTPTTPTLLTELYTFPTHLVIVRQVGTNNCLNAFVLRGRMGVVAHHAASNRP